MNPPHPSNLLRICPHGRCYIACVALTVPERRSMLHTFPMPKTLKLKRYRSWMHIFLHVRGAPTLFFSFWFLFGRFSFVGCLIPVGMRRAPFRLGYAICKNDVSVLAMPLIYVEKQATAPSFLRPGQEETSSARATCWLLLQWYLHLLHNPILSCPYVRGSVVCDGSS